MTYRKTGYLLLNGHERLEDYYFKSSKLWQSIFQQYLNNLIFVSATYTIIRRFNLHFNPEQFITVARHSSHNDISKKATHVFTTQYPQQHDITNNLSNLKVNIEEILKVH